MNVDVRNVGGMYIAEGGGDHRRRPPLVEHQRDLAEERSLLEREERRLVVVGQHGALAAVDEEHLLPHRPLAHHVLRRHEELREGVPAEREERGEAVGLLCV